ncbi:MAG: hypothetical protein M1840_007930 [Geoglossum simile]|nr:MAG: hypothetical protein M1840_007930 [Geoglossum simile]
MVVIASTLLGITGLALTGSLLVGGAEGSSYARALVSSERSERDSSSAAFCCTLLSFQLGSKVSFPTSQTYETQSNSYWSLQEANLLPACRLAPTSSKDVSVAIAALSKYHCPFAIRGGGHMSWAGAANIENGVTIDMGAMDVVEVSEERRVVSVGAGARWGTVYSKLEPLGLAVSGGRISDVGVAGLILGGGISFFSPRFGFVCDTVSNFEIVLANGDVTNANASSNPDLYHALKGGSNNFGIITRFDMLAFPQGDLWGGVIIAPISTIRKQFEALEEFVSASETDPYASVMNIYLYKEGSSVSLNSLVYTKPEQYPPILKGFTDIEPQFSSSTRITSLYDITQELTDGVPQGFRQLFATVTFGNNAALFSTVYNVSETIFTPLKSIPTLQYTLVFQPITAAVHKATEKSGGNPLGLIPDNGNLLILDINILWTDEADDEAVTKAAEAAVTGISASAKKAGLHSEFTYLNYALPSQDPILSYGMDNLRKLRETARKYDPKQVFQRLVPGGFKLYRSEEIEPYGPTVDEL